MTDYENYDNPLIVRYASRAMAALWSPRRKFTTWRKLWLALAEAEAELGLPISNDQLAAMRSAVDDVDFASAERYERSLRHDVMAHVHAFGDACPAARGVIHWGATSCYVTDNTDLLLMREGLSRIALQIVGLIRGWARFALEHRSLACLAYTHLQPAQPTTVGKRACLWAYDLVYDLEEIERRIQGLKARGVKGTTGTQASFLELFSGDHDKVRALEAKVAEKIGFKDCYAVTGQTYSRKVDSGVLDSLSSVAQSAHKFATDLRLLQAWKEMEEPFEKEQIGSSAMAYKRNPMRAERICGLARFVTSLQSSASATASVQWMERTLDDSANRRLTLPQAFLAIDAVLTVYGNVVDGLVVYPQVIANRLAAELPFMATENLLMQAVANGGDRQELHERIRVHSQAAAAVVKQQGGANDLLERLRKDEAFQGVPWDTAMDPAAYVGRAPEQVDEFVSDVVQPILKRYNVRLEDREPLAPKDELRV